jgi:hypothetical protein
VDKLHSGDKTDFLKYCFHVTNATQKVFVSCKMENSEGDQKFVVDKAKKS